MNEPVNLEELDIPAGAKGHIYIRCPKCSPDRKKKYQKVLGWNVEEQYGRCNHCDTGLYVKKDRIPELVIKTSTEFPVEILNYINSRGISKETLDACNVSHTKEFIIDKESGKGRTIDCIAFKYNWRNVLRMVKYRDNKKNFAIKKATGSELILFNIDHCIDNEEVTICEGEFDTLSFYESGVINCISVPNGASVSKSEKEHFEKTGQLINENVQDLKYITECFDIFKNKKKIYIATDSDPAGYKLQEELVRRLGKHRCYKVKFYKYVYTDSNGNEKRCKDANELLVNFGKEALQTALNEAEEYPIENIVSIKDTLSTLKHQYTHGIEKAKSTGFKVLDNYLNLLMGTPMVCNGYPGMGKTSFTLQIMLNTIVLYGWKWLVFSPENHPHSRLVSTMVKMLTGKPIDKKYKGVMTVEEMEEAVNYLNEYIYMIDDKEEGWSHEDLRNTISSFVERKGINCALVDPYNSATKGIGQSSDKETPLNIELSAYTRLAVKHNILVWINAHPKAMEKQYHHTAPHIMDLAGGAMWNNKMYLALCVHIANREDPECTISEIHVDKVKFQDIMGIPTQRSCPPTLTFKRRNQRYYERDEQGVSHCPLDLYNPKTAAQQQIEFQEIKNNTLDIPF